MKLHHERIISRLTPGGWRLAGAVLWLAVLPAGCSEPQAGIVLVQPQLTGLQRQLWLASSQVRWSEEDGRFRMFADLPLPGASTGRAAYVLYVQVEDRREAPGQDVRGFLVQTRGENAGLAMITGGRVQVAGPSVYSGPRQICLELAFEDGSRIDGALRGLHDEHGVRFFESVRYAYDVQSVRGGPPATAPSP